MATLPRLTIPCFLEIVFVSVAIQPQGNSSLSALTLPSQGCEVPACKQRPWELQRAYPAPSLRLYSRNDGQGIQGGMAVPVGDCAVPSGWRSAGCPLLVHRSAPQFRSALLCEVGYGTFRLAGGLPGGTQFGSCPASLDSLCYSLCYGMASVGWRLWVAPLRKRYGRRCCWRWGCGCSPMLRGMP